jgi:hypothetical protein
MAKSPAWYVCRSATRSAPPDKSMTRSRSGSRSIPRSRGLTRIAKERRHAEYIAVEREVTQTHSTLGRSNAVSAGPVTRFYVEPGTTAVNDRFDMRTSPVWLEPAPVRRAFAARRPAATGKR